MDEDLGRNGERRGKACGRQSATTLRENPLPLGFVQSGRTIQAGGIRVARFGRLFHLVEDVEI